jgi:hypothetical protein
VVKTLAELGADKEATDADGWRPLHVAAGHGQVEVVTTLVELGADIGALTDNGETPLQLSIRRGHHQVAGASAEGARTFRPHPKGGCGQEAHVAGLDHAERMGALVIEEEEREEAQRKVRGCSTLTLAELHGTRLDGVSIAHGLSAS